MNYFNKYFALLAINSLSTLSVTGLTKSSCDLQNFTHVTAMAHFAIKLREQLEYVNEHSFNNFKLRIGE